MFTMYLDDTGTASLRSYNPLRPVTCLCGVVVEDSVYRNQMVPGLSRFVSRWFKGKKVVLRRFDIHTAKGPFVFLRDKKARQRFHKELNELLASFDFKIIAVVVNVPQLIEWQSIGYKFPDLPSNDYIRVIALALERFARLLLDEKQARPGISGRVVIETKGRKEDGALRDFYQNRLLRSGTQYYKPYELAGVLPQTIELVGKAPEEFGLQAADWLAWPIANAVENQGQDLSSDPKYQGINEWELYKGKIWLGARPNSPGNVGLKTLPDSGLGRGMVGVPLEKPTALPD